MLLAKRDINPTMVSNGLEGLETALARPGGFNLVFMDNNMPVMVRRTSPYPICLFSIFA